MSYVLHANAWAPLPRPHEHGSRALVAERYVEYVRPAPEPRSRKATKDARTAGNWASGSDADQNARDRADAQQRYGSAKGARISQARSHDAALSALAADPTLRRLGKRELVSDEIVRHSGKPCFRVRCDCGALGFAGIGQWVKRSDQIGRACATCARNAQKR